MSRQSTRVERFDRHGLLAIDPRAFFELFAVPTSRTNARVGQVEIVEVSGPLVQRDELWCDSYEAIRARVAEACAGECRAIIMRFDSPGGDASGCFETARALRAQADAAHKPLIAYIDKACSAAYALASAAGAIFVGETCPAGSIGVLSSRPDQTVANTQRGLRMAFVVSGSRKLDGNPDYPVTEAELAETQRHVDDLAAKFFELIADQRPQLPAAQVAAFDGAVFYGEGAVEAGLADYVATFEDALAFASAGGNMSLLQFTAKSDYDTALASLQKVAKGKDANARAARKALNALAAAGPGEDDDDEPAEEPAEEPEEPATQGDPPAPEPVTDPPPPPAAQTEPPQSAAPAGPPPAASGGGTELQLHARLHRLEALAEARASADERAALLAKRPDFDPAMRTALAKAPIETVREFVATLPKKKVARAAITTVPAARGSTAGPMSVVTSSAETLEIDRRMGLTQQKVGCRREGSTLFFGVVSDEVPQPTPIAPTVVGQP